MLSPALVLVAIVAAFLIVFKAILIEGSEVAILSLGMVRQSAGATFSSVSRSGASAPS